MDVRVHVAKKCFGARREPAANRIFWYGAFVKHEKPVVARSPLAMATLRVCPGYGSGYNCGTCLKCLRTALDLQTIGALESCATLPRTIDAEALRFALAQGGGPAHVADYRRRLAALATVPGTEPTRRVLAEHLARERDGRIAPHNPRRSRQRGSRLVGRWLGRGG